MVFIHDGEGVYCYEHPELGWLTCEDSCVSCGRVIDECDCDEPELHEADTSEEEIGNLTKNVYQVRVNGGDGGFLGRVDMECIDDCFRAITDYHYTHNSFDDTLTITLTPKLDEDRCEFFGIPYDVKVIYTIKKGK